jgi:shikimate kinase
MMGCGKTAIGTRLAKYLGVPFIDADQKIEERASCSVSQIFEYLGEPKFREMEREAIQEVLAGEPCILATGGGAFMQDETRALILEKSLCIWLKAPFEVLLERVSRKKTRPLLEKGDKAEILKKLLEERTPFYEKAHAAVESGPSGHHIVVQAVADAIATYQQNKHA